MIDKLFSLFAQVGRGSISLIFRTLATGDFQRAEGVEVCDLLLSNAFPPPGAAPGRGGREGGEGGVSRGWWGAFEGHRAAENSSWKPQGMLTESRTNLELAKSHETIVPQVAFHERVLEGTR